MPGLPCSSYAFGAMGRWATRNRAPIALHGSYARVWRSSSIRIRTAIFAGCGDTCYPGLTTTILPIVISTILLGLILRTTSRVSTCTDTPHTGHGSSISAPMTGRVRQLMTYVTRVASVIVLQPSGKASDGSGRTLGKWHESFLTDRPLLLARGAVEYGYENDDARRD